MSYQAVLWDFGGVITSSPFAGFNRYDAERGLPLDFIRRVNATDPDTNAWAQFEANRIDIETFDHLFLAESTAAGHAIPGREVIALLSGDVRPRMVQVLRRVKRDFKIACLTNNVRAGKGPGMSRSEASAERVREAMALFEHVLESSREGLRKPQPEFYLLACERLGVNPARVVYLDDLGINLKPARELGMTTIKVVSEAQAIRDLGTTLGVAL
jgi:putative hydrolase of the HAD superfamily